MALYHFSVKQIRRSAGQSAVASAAYRAGEKLVCTRYGETHDYTRKRGVIHTEIFLPEHAPREYLSRETLWNAVEKAERGCNVQLAYVQYKSQRDELSRLYQVKHAVDTVLKDPAAAKQQPAHETEVSL